MERSTVQSCLAAPVFLSIPSCKLGVSDLHSEQPMHVQRIAAFSQGAHGGNPAGVVLCEALPAAEEMLTIAAEVGYSETVFAAPNEDGWRVRYFAPEIEVPFCGHATIA